MDAIAAHLGYFGELLKTDDLKTDDYWGWFPMTSPNYVLEQRREFSDLDNLGLLENSGECVKNILNKIYNSNNYDALFNKSTSKPSGSEGSNTAEKGSNNSLDYFKFEKDDKKDIGKILDLIVDHIEYPFELICGCINRMRFRYELRSLKDPLKNIVIREIGRISDDEFRKQLEEHPDKKLNYSLKCIYKDDFPKTYLPLLIVSLPSDSVKSSKESCNSKSAENCKEACDSKSMNKFHRSDEIPTRYVIESMKVRRKLDYEHSLYISRYYADVYDSGLCKLYSHDDNRNPLKLLEYSIKKYNRPEDVEQPSTHDEKIADAQYHEIFNAFKELFHIHSHHSDENHSADCIIRCVDVPSHCKQQKEYALSHILDTYKQRIILYHELVSPKNSKHADPTTLEYAKLAHGVFYYAINFLKIFRKDFESMDDDTSTSFKIDVDSEIDAFKEAQNSLSNLSSSISSLLDVRYGRTIRVTSVILGMTALLTAIACTLYGTYPTFLFIAIAFDAVAVLVLFISNYAKSITSTI